MLVCTVMAGMCVPNRCERFNADSTAQQSVASAAVGAWAKTRNEWKLQLCGYLLHH